MQDATAPILNDLRTITESIGRTDPQVWDPKRRVIYQDEIP